MNDAGIVIIGAGNASVCALIALRAEDYRGPIKMIAEEGADAPYERPPLSKWSSEGPQARPILPAAQLSEAGVTRITAKVVSFDPTGHEVNLSDGSIVPYARLLMATGASARKMDAKLTSGTNVFYLRDMTDAQDLHHAAQSAASAIIIGGGFIGLELAASLRGNGLRVHVVEAADRLLSRAITAPVAKIVHDLHQSHDVTFSFNAQVSSISGAGNVLLNDGTEFSADMIVVGIGSVANVALAQDAGLLVRNGIVVDAYMRTSDPDVFAAGDCCSFPLYGDATRMIRLESWQAAGNQGAIAGRNMVHSDQFKCDLVPWFWSEQYDHVLQVSGLSVPEMETVDRAYGADHHVSFGLSNSGMLAYACGIAPGTKVAKDIRFSAKMIETRIAPDYVKLADTAVALKSLLRS